MQRRFALLVLLALLGAVAAGASCSATSSSGTFTGSGATGNASGSASGGSTTGHTGMGGGLTLGTGGLGTTCNTHCSADLHDILDCNNNVVMMCPPDQGCGAMGCVPACQSAQENKSTIGCDYYSVDPDIISEAAGACFAAFIANTWDAPVTIQVERAGVMLDATKFSYIPTGTGQSITYNLVPATGIPPGQVAIVFLGASPGVSIGACPTGVTVGYPMDPSVAGTGIGDAFHITTSAPVVAYDIFPYGGGQAAATSATLLIPTTAWDTNYIAVDAYAQSVVAASAGAQPSIDIVASKDGTTVTILPVVAIVGGSGVQPAAANTPTTYNLNKGQYLQLSQPAELTGSVIQSNYPVGHWGGASCLNIPTTAVACDSAHQQIPPIKALGHEYVAVRYRNRFDGMEETVPWRMVGAVDGTVLTYDPMPPPSGAPVSLKQGQLVEFDTNGPFSVKSQDDMHPFYMSAHMTGCSVTDPAEDDCRGDPEFVNIIPPQQYLAQYTFFTDPTYPETNLVVIRSKDTAGFHDVKLDCAGTLTGWMPLGSAGNYEYTRIDLVRYNFMGQNGCDNGRHQIQSDAPFGLTVWGWGSAATMGCFGGFCGGFYSQAVSYAYPAGASVQPINTVIVPPMAH